MKFEFNVPRPRGLGPLPITLESGRSLVIVGANGSGKTRLSVYLEDSHRARVVRIPAHKSLALNDKITLISLERAENALRFGYPDGGDQHRVTHRWGNNPATHLLSDFDALLQRLFAEHNRAASAFLRAVKTNASEPVPTTRFEKLKEIWDNLLSHRKLLLLEASVEVLTAPSDRKGYTASQMSDGERAIFYFLGQCLVAPADSCIIVDEPEAHVHKAILGHLWDSIERARPDCAFLYITHDIDFSVTRGGSARYFVRAFESPNSWDIDKIPEDAGLPDHVVAELVGSRKPILFIEGERGSLDLTLYRELYAQFSITPVGSCDAVIRSVASYKSSAALHWLNARGLVDGDDRDDDDIAMLASRNVYVLPVAEVENLLLLPDVFVALAEGLMCANPSEKLSTLETKVMAVAASHIDLVSARHATRQLDRHLKRITVAAEDLATLEESFRNELASVDPAASFTRFRGRLEACIRAVDMRGVLRLYDNKGLLGLGANILGIKGPKDLMER